MTDLLPLPLLLKSITLTELFTQFSRQIFQAGRQTEAGKATRATSFDGTIRCFYWFKVSLNLFSSV